MELLTTRGRLFRAIQELREEEHRREDDGEEIGDAEKLDRRIEIFERAKSMAEAELARTEKPKTPMDLIESRINSW